MLDAGFAKDEDGVFGGREVEDAGCVDCGAVGGAENFVLFRLSIGAWSIIRGAVDQDELEVEGERGPRTTSAGMPMAWSFSWYSARDLVLLFVTKMICFPGRKKGGVGVWF